MNFDNAMDVYKERYGRNPNSTAPQFCREVTFQVTERCNLSCTYCYQIHKTPKVMSWEVAKAGVDLLFNMWIENEPDAFINQKTEFIILDFIGGEPMLEVKLIDRICDYFMNQALEINPLWAETFMISMASNGTIYFTPEVQHFLHKWDKRLSYSVSMDGPKEMHDACRIFPDGRGSFDLAKAAQDDYNKTHRMQSGTKATISWQNMPYLDTTIKYYVDQGYRRIHANTVYEEDWTPEQGAFFYKKLKEVADFMLSLDGKVEISLFDKNFFKPRTDMEQTWCFGAGTQILTENGYKNIEDIKVGNMVMTHKGYSPVEEVKSHLADNAVKAHVSGAFDFICTDDHPFICRLKNSNNVKAIPLNQINDEELMLFSNIDEENDLPAFDFITGITTESVDPCVVYNLTVKDVHTYIANGILVHNCGGYDSMLAFDPDGNAFPCIRYMESSLGGQMPPVIIGDVWNGLWKTPEQKHCHDCLACITWTTQNDEECLNCPIAQGCADCAAESYQHMKCFNKRHKLGSCWVHRARSLANVYYWNKLWRQQGSTERFKRYLPDDIALQIVSKEELEYLNSLEQE